LEEEQAGKEGAEGSRNENATNSSMRPQRPELSTKNLNETEKGRHGEEEKVAIESPRSPNTFPSALPGISNPAGHRRRSKTLPVNPKKKGPLPQLLQFFRKKASRGQLIQNED
jgi:hypothetical protein